MLHVRVRQGALRGAARAAARALSPTARSAHDAERLTLTLGPPAAGGGMAARDGSGRVVFVRHGLPGERVVAEVTESHPSWVRADAVEVLEASADRVEPPCPYAGPGRCGGCDYQHAALPAQRALKGARLADQLRRVAALELDVPTEAIGERRDGLHTRTRVRYATNHEGRLAMRRNRSWELVEVERCALATAANGALEGVLLPPHSEVEVTALDPTGAVTVAVRPIGARREPVALEGPGLAPLQRAVVAGQPFVVGPGSFWQVHVAAPATLAALVLEGLALSPGDRVADLYCGVGLFSALAARAVTATGHVVAVDASTAATADARQNLAALPWAEVRTASVDAGSVRAACDDATRAVLDPPRRGVERTALDALCASRTLARVVLVACDPSTFARDLARLLARGWQLASLRALDAFEMTEHLELVAVLDRGG